MSTDDAQDAMVSLLESRAKGILKNVKADAMERRDANILKAAERLLKWVIFLLLSCGWFFVWFSDVFVSRLMFV